MTPININGKVVKAFNVFDYAMPRHETGAFHDSIPTKAAGRKTLTWAFKGPLNFGAPALELKCTFSKTEKQKLSRVVEKHGANSKQTLAVLKASMSAAANRAIGKIKLKSNGRKATK